MIGTSYVMQQVYKNIAKITKSNYSVLITGESGTGKELVAKAIHNFSSVLVILLLLLIWHLCLQKI